MTILASAIAYRKLQDESGSSGTDPSAVPLWGRLLLVYAIPVVGLFIGPIIIFTTLLATHQWFGCFSTILTFASAIAGYFVGFRLAQKIWYR
jgi:hypothetical protein